ncbi:hypothetical protein PverR02_24110 [Pseudomonas veronii]|nr:hypothetical protein PverR02_24110 [Pseudomonas veronii]
MHEGIGAADFVAMRQARDATLGICALIPTAGSINEHVEWFCLKLFCVASFQKLCEQGNLNVRPERSARVLCRRAHVAGMEPNQPFADGIWLCD